MNQQELEHAIAVSRAAIDEQKTKELFAAGWMKTVDGYWLAPDNTPRVFKGPREAWEIMVALQRANL